MEAVAPFAKVFGFSPVAETFIAVVLGIGFGFALENGGLGNAKVLAGQWFGYNFAVFRVMFTAIVVAMLGIFGLHYAGVLNFELVYVNPTYFWPQLVGGLIFGFGFAYGQHCPGTAVAGASTGNLDAMSWLVGFAGGAVLFGFVQPYIDGFYESSSWGRMLLTDALHLPLGVVIVVVVAIAVGSFAFLEVLDKKLGNKPASGPTFGRGFLAFGGALSVAAVAVLAVSLRGEPTFQLASTVELAPGQQVLPAELADWIVSGRRDFVVVDMRSRETYERAHVLGAVNCGSCHENEAQGVQSAQFVDLSKKLVLYTDGDAEPIALPKVLHRNRQIFRLAGGWEGWKREILAPVSFEGAADPTTLDALQKREAVRAYMAGERPAAPAAPRLPVAPIRRVTPHAASTASEGC